MNDYLSIYETGLQYASTAEALANSNRFKSNMAINMIGLATECLLGAIVEQHNIYVAHISVGTLGQALVKANIFPCTLQKQLALLSLGCAVCSISGDDAKFAPSMDKLLLAFTDIKQWVVQEMAPQCKAV